MSSVIHGARSEIMLATQRVNTDEGSCRPRQNPPSWAGQSAAARRKQRSGLVSEFVTSKKVRILGLPRNVSDK